MTPIADIRRAHSVVVGSGVAGLSVALGLGNCLLLTRGNLGSGSTGHAQGGIAASLAPDDQPVDHAADTLGVAGAIGSPEVARVVTEAAAGRIDWLRSIGARFDTDSSGKLLLGREAGHRTHRIVHAGGDATGNEVVRALAAAVTARPDIEICSDYDLIDVIVSDGCAAGVLAAAPSGELVAVLSSAVVLATGGIGGLFARTTNPPEITGDGLAAAARAGAQMADLEFVQFHPTALDRTGDPLPLITEALRGEGAMLVNDRGERFMAVRDSAVDLAPRDVLARAIWEQHAEGRTVYLDATRAIGTSFPRRFPSVWKHALEAGFDPCTDRVPVTPAQHYFMGGVATDSNGRSSLPGLWAVGEVASTGLHGANRLASNSLLEAIVVAAGVSKSIGSSEVRAAPSRRIEVPADALRAPRVSDGSCQAAVRALMWERVGILRDASGLRDALFTLDCRSWNFV